MNNIDIKYIIIFRFTICDCVVNCNKLFKDNISNHELNK